MKELINSPDFLIKFLLIWGAVQSFYFSLFMGMVLRWHLHPDPVKKQRAGYLWHGIAALIRIGVPILFIPVYFVVDWHILTAFLLGFVWLNWVWWDAICNLSRPLEGNFFQRFFYSGTVSSGTTSIIDRLLGQYLPFIKMAFTIITIIGIIMLLTI